MKPSSDGDAQQARDEQLRRQVLVLAGRLGLAATRIGDARGVRGIVKAARRAGLPALRRRTTWDGLPAAVPAIAILTNGGTILVTGIEDRAGPSMVIFEATAENGSPAAAVDRARFEAAWTGELIVLRPPRAPDGWRLTRRSMARLLLGEPRALRDLCGATAGLALLAVVPVLFVQLALGRILDRHAGQTLAVALAVLGAVLLAELALRGLASFCAGGLAARWQARLSVAILDRLLRLPPDAVGRLPAGEIRARFRALEAAHRALAVAAPGAMLELATAVVALPLLMVLDWPVALVALATLGGVAVTATQVAGRLRRATAARARAGERRDGALLRVLAEAGAIKGYALEPDRLAAWEALSGATAGAEAGPARMLGRLSATVPPLEHLVVLGALGIGVAVPAVSGEPVPIPALVAAVVLVGRAGAALARLPDLLAALAEAETARRSLAALVNRPREPVGPAEPLAGGLAFERAGIRFPGMALPALEGVSFAVEAGMTVGVFGPSGAGKSTLARLITRNLTATSGAVRLDGRDVRGLDPASVRRQALAVTGRETIFAGSVRDTVTARKPDATFDEMTSAARVAGLDEVVERLPQGFETPLAAGAPTLSAGERQRLALARAVIGRPPILILDEALFAVDPESEQLVLERLRAARAGATTILISHRVSGLATADRVLVLLDGRLLDQGAPADLAERCDLFRRAAMAEAADGMDDDRPGRRLALR